MPDQAELQPLSTDAPNSGILNRLFYLLTEKAPGWIGLLGYNGTRYTDSGAVASAGNAALHIKPAAGIAAILCETSAGIQILLVNDAGITIGVGLSLGGNLFFVPDATYNIGASGAVRPRDLFLSRDATIGRNLLLPGTSARILGPFEHATRASRPFFQSNAANGDTNVNAMPSGTNTISKFEAYNNATPGSATGIASLEANNTEVRLTAAAATGAGLPLQLYAGGVKSLEVSTAGVVSLPVGQLAFPSTQNPSADPNTLDDYETGIWTPVLVTTGLTTYTLQSATYTKIGQQVTVCCTLIVNVKAAGASTASIGGFPFTVGAVPGTAAVNFWASSATAYVFLAGLMAPATTQVDFYGVTAAATGSSLAIIFQNAARIQFSGSYFV